MANGLRGPVGQVLNEEERRRASGVRSRVQPPNANAPVDPEIRRAQRMVGNVQGGRGANVQPPNANAPVDPEIQRAQRRVQGLRAQQVGQARKAGREGAARAKAAGPQNVGVQNATATARPGAGWGVRGPAPLSTPTRGGGGSLLSRGFSAGVAGVVPAAVSSPANVEQGVRATGRAPLNPMQAGIAGLMDRHAPGVVEGVRDFGRNLFGGGAQAAEGTPPTSGAPPTGGQGVRLVDFGQQQPDDDVQVPLRRGVTMDEQGQVQGTPEQPQAAPVQDSPLRQFQPVAGPGGTEVRGPRGQGVAAEGGLGDAQAERISGILNQPGSRPQTDNERAMEESRANIQRMQTELEGLTGNRSDLPARRARLQQQIANEQNVMASLAGNVSGEQRGRDANQANLRQARIQAAQNMPSEVERRQALADLQVTQQEIDQNSRESLQNQLADSFPGRFRNEDGEIDQDRVGPLVAQIERTGIPDDPVQRRQVGDLAGLSLALADHAEQSSRPGGSGVRGDILDIIPFVNADNIEPAANVPQQMADLVEFIATADEDTNRAKFRGQDVAIEPEWWGLLNRGIDQDTRRVLDSFQQLNESQLEQLLQSLGRE